MSRSVSCARSARGCSLAIVAPVRIAAYNVENLFDRAKALNAETWAQGRPVLDRHARINKLLAKSVYTERDKANIVLLLEELGLGKSDDGGEFAMLRQNRGRLVKRPKAGGIEIVASGREEWVGWVELKTEAVDELATRHTAMVIRDTNADILGVVEAENRISLRDFSKVLLAQVDARPYPHVMVIDGNDGRGIDVGILTRDGFAIGEIVSHVDDGGVANEVFSRDCPEYTVRTSSGASIVVMVNHFKSKGYGKPADSNARRKRQAERVAELYRARRDAGQENVVVLGDLNDTPDSDPLSPLIAGTDLKDISTHPRYRGDGRPGTYANGTASNKIDYILLSPALYAKVTDGTVLRKGVWGGTNGTLFPHYESMTKAHHAASDHAALVAEVDI